MVLLDLLGGPGGLSERSSRISGRSCWTDRELLEDLLVALGFSRHTSPKVMKSSPVDRVKEVNHLESPVMWREQPESTNHVSFLFPR